MSAGRDVTTKKKIKNKNKHWSCAQSCDCVVLRNFDTVLQVLLLIAVLKLMDLFDLNAVSTASLANGEAIWSPSADT